MNYYVDHKDLGLCGAQQIVTDTMDEFGTMMLNIDRMIPLTDSKLGATVVEAGSVMCATTRFGIVAFQLRRDLKLSVVRDADIIYEEPGSTVNIVGKFHTSLSGVILFRQVRLPTLFELKTYQRVETV